jgi:hypothetical protein
MSPSIPSGNVRFDHFITYVDSPSIDRHLDEYRQAGFLANDQTVRHDPGLRNGFVSFGSLYVEFCWVEDETAFAAGDPDEAVLRRARRPFGIGLVSDALWATHAEWIARGYELPDVVTKAERNASPDTPPRWSFQEIPEHLLPGAQCFALTYHRPRQPGVIAPNSTYAIAGATFVSSAPDAHALAWRDLLAPGAAIDRSNESHQITIGSHVASWIAPAQYEREYGRPWQPAPHRFGELAILHVLATDLERASAAVVGAGRDVVPVPRGSGGGRSIFLPPSPRDGFSFVVSERPRHRDTRGAEPNSRL